MTAGLAGDQSHEDHTAYHTRREWDLRMVQNKPLGSSSTELAGLVKARKTRRKLGGLPSWGIG